MFIRQKFPGILTCGGCKFPDRGLFNSLVYILALTIVKQQGLEFHFSCTVIIISVAPAERVRKGLKKGSRRLRRYEKHVLKISL